MTFAEMIKHQTQITTTENGAMCYNTTNSPLLNLFSRVGALRQNSDEEIISLYLAARQENEDLADRLVLYSRDIREGGAGERRVGRLLFKTLATLEPEKVKRNLLKFVDLGRWDDLFVLEDTPCEEAMWGIVTFQLRTDIKCMKEKQPISLLFKWLPSINTSSKETKRLAKKYVKILGISEKQYRKMLSNGRRYLDVVEKKMSIKDWDNINFEIVPSKAMSNYSKAFARNTPKFEEYLNKLKEGKAKINAGAIYPYELLRPIINELEHEVFYGRTSSTVEEQIDVIEAQWKALPNYIEPGQNVLCIADCSGSMYDGFSIAASVGLSIYFAERNTGPYKDMVLSFASNPKFIDLSVYSSLKNKAKAIIEHDGMSTNFDKTLNLIFDVANKTKDVPKALILISDGEIDRYTSHFKYEVEDIFSKWKNKFEEGGLVFPKIIFWRADNCSASHYLTQNIKLCSLVSGNSPAIFKNLTSLIDKDAYAAMVEILSNPIYSYN